MSTERSGTKTTTGLRRPVRWIALAGVLGLLALLILPKIDLTGGEDSTADESAGPPPPKVAVQIVQESRTEAPITLPGTLLPNEEVSISSEVAGKIVRINFSEGSFVQRGAVLAQLNSAELRAARKKAESNLHLAELSFQRKGELLQRDGISQAEYEVAIADLEAARADLAVLDEQIRQRVVRAPFSGRIGLRNVSVGEYVTPSTVITVLTDTDPLKLEFSIPERYAHRAANGIRFNYRVEGIDVPRIARVYAIAPGVDAETRTLKVRAMAPNNRGDMIPGQFASVELPTGSTSPLPIVPTQALLPTQGGQQLYLIRDGVVTPVNVITGSRSASHIEILEGVGAGDTIVVEGLQSVRPGAPVDAVLYQPTNDQ